MVGSFPIGFTSQIAGAGAILIGIIGRGGPCPPPRGPPRGPPGGPLGGVPGLIGGGVGEGGLDPSLRKDCRVVVGWSCMLVTILAIRNGSVRSCVGMLRSLNPSGSYSNNVEDKAGDVVGFWGELLWVLVASCKPSSRSFTGFSCLVSNNPISGAEVPSVGSCLLWSFTLYHWFWYKQTGVLCWIDSALSWQKAKYG